jgi:hypothetical protein
MVLVMITIVMVYDGVVEWLYRSGRDDSIRCDGGEKLTYIMIVMHCTDLKDAFYFFSVGTLNQPTVEEYSKSKQVKLEEFDTFLIFACKRFTKNDQLLADKVDKFKKSFFFIRTHIDEDIRNESRKRAFNEEAMLSKIRKRCLKNLDEFGIRGQAVFLISNHDTAKWDFPLLTQAILDALPSHQKECLTLSLKTLSIVMLKRKTNVLRGKLYVMFLMLL